MESPVIFVIDHFYDDPHAVREEALSCRYRRGKTYPGMNSVKRFHVDEAMKKIGNFLRKPLRWEESTANGRYRISLASDPLTVDIHPDSFMNEHPFPQWGGVCFLSLPQDCQGGVSFWRHNQTGLTHYPITLKERTRVSRIADILNTPEALSRYFLREGIHRSRWTEIKRAPMTFNRLVLFKSPVFHSHTINFGKDREHGRLVQLFLFDELDYFVQTTMAYNQRRGYVF